VLSLVSIMHQLIWELAFSNFVNWELIGYEAG
jgi:hypothetical protein